MNKKYWPLIMMYVDGQNEKKVKKIDEMHYYHQKSNQIGS